MGGSLQATSGMSHAGGRGGSVGILFLIWLFIFASHFLFLFFRFALFLLTFYFLREFRALGFSSSPLPQVVWAKPQSMTVAARQRSYTQRHAKCQVSKDTVKPEDPDSDSVAWHRHQRLGSSHDCFTLHETRSKSNRKDKRHIKTRRNQKRREKKEEKTADGSLRMEGCRPQVPWLTCHKLRVNQEDRSIDSSRSICSSLSFLIFHIFFVCFFRDLGLSSSPLPQAVCI